MIEHFSDFSLRTFNTFGLDVHAKSLISFTHTEEINKVIHNSVSYDSLLILGGGSNILFTDNYSGLVIQPKIMGVEVLSENAGQTRVRVGAGENWDTFVQWAVDRGLGGIENLSLIPGNVGSCPIQNIGAYGTEVKDVIEAVEYFDLEKMENSEIAASECDFGYRNSIFKSELKNKVIITHVRFNLNNNPSLNIGYGNLKDELKNKQKVTIEDVRMAVCSIRRKKLPDPSVIGNAGSFFKNPAISKEEADRLSVHFPDMPRFATQNEQLKIPAGWLIEKCGWKGFREGDAGVHVNQALVLVNYGNATGKEILTLARKIKKSVVEKFGISIEMEVNVI